MQKIVDKVSIDILQQDYKEVITHMPLDIVIQMISHLSQATKVPLKVELWRKLASIAVFRLQGDLDMLDEFNPGPIQIESLRLLSKVLCNTGFNEIKDGNLIMLLVRAYEQVIDEADLEDLI